MSKTILIEEDIHKHILNYEHQYYDSLKNKESYESLQKDILQSLYQEYEIMDETDTSILTLSKRHYLQNYLKTTIQEMVHNLHLRIQNQTCVKEQLQYLKTLELPEQRSQEWYDLRENLLTASSLADALGKGHFNTRESLLIDKTSTEKKPFYTNNIIQWGVKYEPIATTFYEKLNQLTIVEFGLIPHPELKVFGASPDGICDEDSPEEYIGRMLEIKCPPIRDFTKEVPLHYWMQMQGQLETCNLEECDFLQVKLTEYEDEEKYNEDIYLEDTTLKEGYSSNGCPKGLVITILSKDEKGNTVYHYEYGDFYLSYDEYNQWYETIHDQYKEEEGYTITKNWWKIERYECTLVYRDRTWWLKTIPKILDFWEDVEHYRSVGNQELIDKKEKRKKNRKKKKQPVYNVIQIDKNVLENDYLLGSDSD